MWVIHSSLTQCVSVCIQGKLDRDISTLRESTIAFYRYENNLSLFDACHSEASSESNKQYTI